MIKRVYGSVQRIGSAGMQVCKSLGRSGDLLVHSLLRWPSFRPGFRLLVEQLFSVGVLSLLIVIASGLFIGMVVGLQGYTTLVRFGAASALGQLIALSIVRELGPVVGALLFAGRAGSALTAEIGLMKATEQLKGLQMLGVDPLRRIIAPRFWAGVYAMPLLAIIFSTVAIWGGYMVGVEWLGVDGGSFWSNMQASVNFREDVVNGLIKAVVFGFIVTWIAVYQGHDCTPTSEGIGRATTRTVVYSSLAILWFDFVLTAVMFGGH